MSSGSEDDSLATEMEIGGEKWIGREVEVYWDKPPDQRGFYGGVVSSYSIVHSPVRDIEYKVKYNDYGKPNVPVSEVWQLARLRIKTLHHTFQLMFLVRR
eukprot:TRINITY_DN4395_c0_g2_i4.p1 TRINITY_DN4395_c0_g2~~TRINITY_DN4395_c0_g2_i4.p1  ORF type:complete len:100 (-),score=21.16 TRINITY_DN4395_c0_g2_i4:11-310(-)